MTTKAFKQCRKPGCSELTKGAYCSKHISKPDDIRLNAGQRGYGYRWQQYSKRFLEQHPLCVKCLRDGKLVPSKVTDHIIDHKGNQDLFWDTSNHQALCKQCHDRKTGQTSHRSNQRGRGV